MARVLWCRVWWWNTGAHSAVVPEEMADEMEDELKASGFYCWRTPAFPIEAVADPPPGS